MTTYVDTSALLKRYVDEPDSDRAVELLVSDAALITGRHTVVEVRRNLGRLLPPQGASAARAAFAEDLASLSIVELYAATCELAATIAEQTGIRSFDASTRWVTHSYEVQGQIEAVRSALGHAEATARGFRLSDDPGLEAQYREVRQLPLQRAEALLQTVRDNPEQHGRAEALRDLFDL